MIWFLTAGPADPDDEVGYVNLASARHLEAVEVTGLSGTTWRIRVDGSLMLRGGYASKAAAVAAIRGMIAEAES